jgi:hypothetical protein
MEIITQEESARLAELEKEIEVNVSIVGRALIEIRTKKLYRATHPTFEDYCQERFDMGRNYVNRQIQAATIIDNLVPIGHQSLPTSERQARPLAKLPAEQQPAAWEKAQEKAKEEGKPVTARHVEEAVKEVMPPKEKSAAEEEPEPLVVDEAKREPIRRAHVKVIESEGMRIWLLAKSHLDRINKNDEFREQALAACIEYCQKRISARK